MQIWEDYCTYEFVVIIVSLLFVISIDAVTLLPFSCLFFQEAFSTPIQPLDILADKPPEKKFEWVSFEFTKILVQHILV